MPYGKLNLLLRKNQWTLVWHIQVYDWEVRNQVARGTNNQSVCFGENMRRRFEGIWVLPWTCYVILASFLILIYFIEDH